MTVAHLLEFLHARGHSVDLFFVNAGAVSSERDCDWLRSVCRTVKSYDLDAWSILRGLLRVPLRGIPFQVGLFSHPRQIREVREAIAAANYDIVYTYYIRSAEATKDIVNLPGGSRLQRGPASFLAMQLSQTLNTRRIVDNAPDLLTKAFYWLESGLIERYEAGIWKHFTRSVLIGTCDLEAVRAACRRRRRPEIANSFLCSHGTDTDRFRPRPDIAVKVNRIVFSGVMRTPTNIQAMQWFAINVWPLVLREVPSAELVIIGREPAPAVCELMALPGITVTGTVPDVSMGIAEAAICIDPMQAGAGMQNKLLEFLACGKATVATSVANEGIGAKNGRHLLIADTQDEFAEAVVRLLRDEQLRNALAGSARKFVLDNWTWEKHFLKLESEFYKALNEKSTEQLAAGGSELSELVAG